MTDEFNIDPGETTKYIEHRLLLENGNVVNCNEEDMFKITSFSRNTKHLKFMWIDKDLYIAEDDELISRSVAYKCNSFTSGDFDKMIIKIIEHKNPNRSKVIQSSTWQPHRDPVTLTSSGDIAVSVSMQYDFNNSSTPAKTLKFQITRGKKISKFSITNTFNGIDTFLKFLKRYD